MTRIVLVRHGQTAWNKEQRFRGQADIPLNAFGLTQAAATGRYVADRWPVDLVYASPLRRTMQTASAVARAQGLTAQPLEGLKDISFGELQGCAVDQVERDHPELLRAWFEVPHTVHFPGGESLKEVRNRIVTGLNQVVAQHTGQTVALVGHTVANRVLLCFVLGWGNERFWRLQQETCAVNVFDVEESGDYTVVLLNDTGHLQGLVE